MPEIWNENGFSFRFYSSDGSEPAHVHVAKQRGTGKWWIAPIRKVRSKGFTRPEEARIENIILENQDLLIEAWFAFFKRPGG